MNQTGMSVFWQFSVYTTTLRLVLPQFNVCKQCIGCNILVGDFIYYYNTIFTRGQHRPSGIVIAWVCVCVCVNFFCPDDNSLHVPARIIKFGPKIQQILLKCPIVFGVDWPWPSRSNLTSFQNSVYLHRFCVLKYLWDLHKNGSFLNCCPAQMIPHICVPYRFQYSRWHGRATDRETV